MTHPSLPHQPKKRNVPIPNPADIDRVRTAIGSNSRDLLLLNLALETGVAASRLLALRVKDLAGLRIGEEIAVLSRGQGHAEPVILGPRSHESFQQYLKQYQVLADDPLFKSRKGRGALSLPSASRLVRSWFDKAGLDGRPGFRSLRKVWAQNRRQTSVELNTAGSGPSASPVYPVNTITAQTTQELAYKELENAIVKARIKPGERLVTEELARQMGISRSPVREAIARLEARNFVTVRPKKGATVNELSERNLQEILEIRRMLECRAAQIATDRATQDLVAHLQRLNEKYIWAQENYHAEDMLAANREFHFSIYRAADMPILMSMIRNLWDQISPYNHIMFRQAVLREPKVGHTYHQQMIHGLAARNPQEVSRWVARDMTESIEFVIGIMRSMRSE